MPARQQHLRYLSVKAHFAPQPRLRRTQLLALKERGGVAVSEMEGEDERHRRRQQVMRRVCEAQEAYKQQRRQAVELQRMAARHAAEQSKATSEKASGRSWKAEAESVSRNKAKIEH